MPQRIGGDSVPAAMKDVARTFGESGVTLDHDTTTVANGAVELMDTSTSSQSYNVGTAHGSYSEAGLVIEAHAGISEITVTAATDTGAGDGVVLERASDGQVVAQDNASIPNGETRTLTPNAPAGRYRVYLYDSDGSADGFYLTDSGGSYIYADDGPWTNTLFDVVDGWLGGGQSDPNLAGISDLSITTDTTVGSLTVEFGTPDTPPTDIVGWDVAYFTRTLDGATVEVYVEEAQGSPGWTEVAGPISRGSSIPADPGNDVRFRVDVSRPSTDENPTLDSILRRYKL